jgi:uncharacterized FlaG/YvyC family protein
MPRLLREEYFMDISTCQSSVAALAPTAAVPTDKSVENREIVQAIRALNAAGLLGQENELLFQRDPESHHVVIRLVDRKTKEVISQVPPEYLLRLAESLKQQGG